MRSGSNSFLLRIGRVPKPALDQSVEKARQGDSRTGDAVTPGPKGGRKVGEEAWIMELPPELRAAIRANSLRRPPRGYEDRLERYFKNIE